MAGPVPAWGLRTSPEAAFSAAAKALLDPMVGEAYVHVQGASQKTYAALLWKLLNSPVTRRGMHEAARFSDCGDDGGDRSARRRADHFDYCTYFHYQVGGVVRVPG